MREQVCGIALAAGKELMRLRGSAAAQGQWQGAQLKTDADDQLHHFLARSLRELYPGIPVLSEEDSSSLQEVRPQRYWLIDPIDGTASFSAGYHGFVTQIAFLEDGEPRFAVVHAPALQLLYVAQAGQGASLNGAVLAAQPKAGRRILIDNYPEPRGCAMKLHAGLACTGYVESGSIGLKICRVADGTADLFVKDVAVRDWDVAPGDLILREAGGSLSRTDGGKYLYHGGFEKGGLIAAHSVALATAAVSCLARARATETQTPSGEQSPP